jgi:hypothetical protein
MRKRSFVVLGLLMLMVVALPTSAIAVRADHVVYGPTTRPLGVSYEAWTRRFARYLFEPPVAESPIVNPTCDAVSHRGGILFMPVATSEGLVVHCSVPAHKPLLVSPGGQFATLGLDADTRRDTKRIADEFMAMTHDAVVKVDGERIQKIGRYKTGSWVRLDLGADNLFGVPAAEYQMFIEGWFVMVRGLVPGRHTIWLGDVFTDPTHTDQVATIKFILEVD